MTIHVPGEQRKQYEYRRRYVFMSKYVNCELLYSYIVVVFFTSKYLDPNSCQHCCSQGES